MRYLPVLLLAVYPLAVAGQNIASALALLIVLIFATRHGWHTARSYLLDPRHLSLLCFVAWSCLATFCNQGSGSLGNIGSYVAGFMPMLLLPPLLGAYLSPTQQDWRKYLYAAVAVIMLWTVIACSQAIWGWRLSGDGVQWGFYRAQALYSHPLTFAYAILLLWPLALALVRFAPRSFLNWLVVLGVAFCLWVSESRTVQLIALVVAFVNVVLYLGRFRWLGIVALISAVLFAGLGDHQLGRKLRDTVGGVADRQSEYPDDRLVFWHAYSVLISRAPLLGHGNDIETEKVRSAYAEIGMQDFAKKYPAHNSYLQVWAETGFVGLLLFMWWIGSYLRSIWRQRHTRSYAVFELQAWLAILAAAITQNAFQDSEVRYGVMLLCIFDWLQSPPSERDSL